MFVRFREQRRQRRYDAERRAQATADFHFIEARIREMEIVVGGADPALMWANVGFASMVPLFDEDGTIAPIEGAAFVGLENVQLWASGMKALIMEWDLNRCAESSSTKTARSRSASSQRTSRPTESACAGQSGWPGWPMSAGALAAMAWRPRLNSCVTSSLG